MSDLFYDPPEAFTARSSFLAVTRDDVWHIAPLGTPIPADGEPLSPVWLRTTWQDTRPEPGS